MKQLIILAFSSILYISGINFFDNDPKASAINESYEKADRLLNKMSLREKIGQMTQITVDVIGKGDNVHSSYEPFEIDNKILNKAISKYKIGSILNTSNNTPFSTKKWYNVIKTIQDKAINEMGIPILYGIDAIHGTTYTKDATLYPQQIGLAATFNTEMAVKLGNLSAYETRASSIRWTFSPVLDLGLDPRWPRHWETFGEDTYLAKEMGKAVVEGYQGNNPTIGKYHVAACLKHFLGYSVPKSGKDRTPAIISKRDLHQYHLPVFKEAIEKGAESIMVNSGLINGIPVHANKNILTHLLKEDLNFKGLVVTDWADIDNLHYRDKVASSEKEAVKLAVNAGIDMAMIPYNFKFCDYLYELVQEGEVNESRIDDAVRRILALKYRLGLFDSSYDHYEEYPEFGSKTFQNLALEAALESITLLKNDNTLPLSKNNKVLITGPNANSIRTLNGGWSYSWQGEKADKYGEKQNTILEAIKNHIGSDQVIYEPGVKYSEWGNYNNDEIVSIENAVEKSKEVDYIIACVGENSYTEKPGDINNLDLSNNQEKLLDALLKTNKPVILILNEGRPRIISSYVERSKGIVQTYLPGNKGGDALALILFGDRNPSGKLPYTYPMHTSSFINYNHKPSESASRLLGDYNYESGNDILFPFGHGLSYTTYDYSNLQLNKTQIGSDENLLISVDVTNSGNRAGQESVLLFTKDLFASISPDSKRLTRFKKIHLQVGETKKLEFEISSKDLAFINQKDEWITEEGNFEIQIHNLTKQFNVTETSTYE